MILVLIFAHRNLGRKVAITMQAIEMANQVPLYRPLLAYTQGSFQSRDPHLRDFFFSLCANHKLLW